jgi:hypothetical protein
MSHFITNDNDVPDEDDAKKVEYASQIVTLRAQVEDLKYTLQNVLQCMIANNDKASQGRYEALIEDARTVLRAKETDYLR